MGTKFKIKTYSLEVQLVKFKKNKYGGNNKILSFIKCNKLKKSCKPVIKWVGGKRQLLSKLKEYMPEGFNTYFEPFIGGGALFFDLKIKHSYINDYNTELYNLYNVIKHQHTELIEDLKLYENTSEYFYYIRSLDKNPEEYSKLPDVKKASRLIYLNKSCFNGLYRVNKKGNFNTSFGNYKNVKYLDVANIKACHELLKDTTILNSDFSVIKKYIKKNDFVYFDPPYVPVSATSNFTAYTDKGFDNTLHINLKNLCDYIDSIGAYFMVSNSYSEYISELYKKYNLITVQANRLINSKATGRGKINEYLIINY